MDVGGRTLDNESGELMATYTQKPGVYHAELWDGVDSRPIDTMMTALYDTDYVGSEINGTTLTLTGQGDLYFPGGNTTFDLPAGQVLIRGPLYGTYQGEAAWQYFPPTVFTARFLAQGE
jgi:hypothetical protein